MDRKLLPFALASLGLVLTACPSDDETGGDTDSDTDPSTTSTTATTTTTTTTTDPTDTDPSTTSTTTTTTDTDTDTDTDTAAGTATIRIVHAAPTAGPVDVYVQGSDMAAFEMVDYQDTTEYAELDAGDYVFEIYAAGADPSVDTPVFTTPTLTLDDESVTTAVAAGIPGAAMGQQEFTVLALDEAFTDKAADEFNARIVHAGSDAPAVDVDVGDDDSAELTAVEFGDDSGADGVALPAETALQVGILADLDAAAMGTEKVTAFTTPDSVAGGTETFIIATGLLDGAAPNEDDGFGLLVVGPNGTVGFLRQNPSVFVVHASPDAGTVDVCAGTDVLLNDVNYGDAAAIQIPPAMGAVVSLDGSADDCDGTSIADVPAVDLEAGERYVVVAAGEATADGGASDLPLTFIATAESFTDNDMTRSGARIKALHAASAPAVELGTIMNGGISAIGNVIIDAIAPGTEAAGETAALAAATYMVGLGADVDMAGDYPNPAVFEASVTVTEDTRLWVLAHGDFDNVNMMTGERPDFFVGAINATDNDSLGVDGAFPWVWDSDITD